MGISCVGEICFLRKTLEICEKYYGLSTCKKNESAAPFRRMVLQLSEKVNAVALLVW